MLLTMGATFHCCRGWRAPTLFAKNRAVAGNAQQLFPKSPAVSRWKSPAVPQGCVFHTSGKAGVPVQPPPPGIHGCSRGRRDREEATGFTPARPRGPRLLFLALGAGHSGFRKREFVFTLEAGGGWCRRASREPAPPGTLGQGLAATRPGEAPELGASSRLWPRCSGRPLYGGRHGPGQQRGLGKEARRSFRQGLGAHAGLGPGKGDHGTGLGASHLPLSWLPRLRNKEGGSVGALPLPARSSGPSGEKLCGRSVPPSLCNVKHGVPRRSPPFLQRTPRRL